MKGLSSLNVYVGGKLQTLVPSFNTNKLTYNLTTDLTSLSITAISLEDFSETSVVDFMVNNTKSKGIVTTSEKTYSWTPQLGEINYGRNIIQLVCNDPTAKPSDPTEVVDFKVYTIYITIISPEPSISNKGLWPIQEHLLRPGYFGGTYIPTYRYLMETKSCGSDDKDFENIYDTQYLINEKNIAYINRTIKNFTNKGKLDAVVELFIHFSGFVNTNWVNDGDYRFYLPIIEVATNRPNNLIDGYQPKNNKLFSFPYCSLEIIGYGQNSELKYENFNNEYHFGIISKFLPGETIQLYPLNYEGILDNFDCGCTSQNLPIISYTQNNFMNEYNASINQRIQSQNALDQNRNFGMIQSGLGAISGLGQAISMGAIGGNVAGGVLQGIGAIVNAGVGIAQNQITYNQGMAAMAAQLKDTEARPSTVTNQNASPSIPCVIKDGVVPYIVKKSIRKSFAEKIDMFFTKYGYRVNKVKVPNLNTRPSWNYLQCSNAYVKGNVPNEDLLEIKSILEHGITFWHTTDVGNYQLNNDTPIK